MLYGPAWRHFYTGGIKGQVVRYLAIMPLYLAIFAAYSGCRVDTDTLSPKTETKSEQKPGDLEATGGSNIWQFNFQSVTSQAGWGVGSLGLLGLIAATIKVRRREHAVDDLIVGIEECKAKAVKDRFRNKGDAWIDRRVDC